MIRQVYKLTKPRQIEIFHEQTLFSIDEVLVKPEYMAICAADRRYYNFERPVEIMNKKVPIALIHEVSGTVYYDSKGEYAPGDAVVIVPTVPDFSDSDGENIKENYTVNSKFCSSSRDGFMQSLVPARRDRIIKVNPENLRAAVLCELLSVAVNAVDSTKADENTVFGIWGDGAVGFVTSVVLRHKFPKSKIVIFGKSDNKLLYFSFAEKVKMGTVKPVIDIAFECVGGEAVGDITDEIISFIKPQGIINLLGVSEYKQNINTRMILEKGLTIQGHSRSSKDDFSEAARMIDENKWVRDALLSIISEEIEINYAENIYTAFERDTYNDFKTILKWRM